MKLRRFSAFFLVGFFVFLTAVLFSSKQVSSDWTNDLEAPTTTIVATAPTCSGGTCTSSVTLICTDNPTSPAGVATGCNFIRYAPQSNISPTPPACPTYSSSSTASYQAYSPGSPITVTGTPGTRTQICAFSIDKAGNYESVKTTIISFAAAPTNTPTPTATNTPTPTATNTPTPTDTPTPTPTNTPTPTPTPVSTWIQGVGGDMRQDWTQGFTNRVVPGPPPPQQYISVNSSVFPTLPQYSSTHGVIYSIGNAVLNYGLPSTNGWVVKNTPYSYSTLKSGTSYIRLNGLDITQNTLPASCNAAPGCILQAAIPAASPNGVYKTSTLHIRQGNIPAGKTYVIIASGEVVIHGDISVNSTSFLLISAGGNITIESTVDNLDGFYSADQDFIARDSGSFRILKVNGLIVANAAGGNVHYLRNQRQASPPGPSIIVFERPDLILNTPEFLKVPNYIWQEVAP